MYVSHWLTIRNQTSIEKLVWQLLMASWNSIILDYKSMWCWIPAIPSRTSLSNAGSIILTSWGKRDALQWIWKEYFGLNSQFFSNLSVLRSLTLLPIDFNETFTTIHSFLQFILSSGFVSTYTWARSGNSVFGSHLSTSFFFAMIRMKNLVIFFQLMQKGINFIRSMIQTISQSNQAIDSQQTQVPKIHDKSV